MEERQLVIPAKSALLPFLLFLEQARKKHHAARVLRQETFLEGGPTAEGQEDWNRLIEPYSRASHELQVERPEFFTQADATPVSVRLVGLAEPSERSLPRWRFVNKAIIRAFLRFVRSEEYLGGGALTEAGEYLGPPRNLLGSVQELPVILKGLIDLQDAVAAMPDTAQHIELHRVQA